MNFTSGKARVRTCKERNSSPKAQQFLVLIILHWNNVNISTRQLHLERVPKVWHSHHNWFSPLLCHWRCGEDLSTRGEGSPFKNVHHGSFSGPFSVYICSLLEHQILDLERTQDILGAEGCEIDFLDYTDLRWQNVIFLNIQWQHNSSESGLWLGGERTTVACIKIIYLAYDILDFWCKSSVVLQSKFIGTLKTIVLFHF